MSIYETIQKDKLKPGANRPTLSLIMSELTVDGNPMDDKSAVTRLSQMSKTCDKNIQLYHKSGNEDMEFEEIGFMNLLSTYLPKGATKEDIELVISDLGVEMNMKSMGRVMGSLKKSFEVVDGNLVKSILMGSK